MERTLRTGAFDSEGFLFNPIRGVGTQRLSAIRTNTQLNRAASNAMQIPLLQSIKNTLGSFLLSVIRNNMVGRYRASYPHPDRNFPTGQIFSFANQFALTDKGGSAFKLLRCEHPKGIAHQNGYAAAALSLGQPPEKDGECSYTQVCLRFTAACREP